MTDIKDSLRTLCAKYHNLLQNEKVWQLDTLLGAVWMSTRSGNNRYCVEEQLTGNNTDACSLRQKEEKIAVLMEELRITYERLADEGITKEMARQKLWDMEQVSRVDVSKPGCVRLVDFGVTINLTPLQCTLYILFLRHDEGIALKQLGNYTDELIELMMKQQHSEYVNSNRIYTIIENLTDPTHGYVNQVVSKIRHAFCEALHTDDAARHYYINGSRNSLYRIPLSRDFVLL